MYLITDGSRVTPSNCSQPEQLKESSERTEEEPHPVPVHPPVVVDHQRLLVNYLIIFALMLC